MDRKQVLLVEDEDNIALALEFLIGRKGFGLTRVASGDAALEALEAAPPDLVVLDVMLPEKSGYEICQHIRQSERLRGVKVLMMTARGGEVERRKGLALGADAFFTKPFDTRELTDEIAHLLES
ncbi:response regulator transcription factor [Histidinibacterium lentulum]|uniref:Response regulator n=1 Tax=Histidinibacterium lentulum TaxID=2480588 RepID=A0A3N2QS59_9RHOB|nr:response regulator [Histidinibacterium lentulum]ROT98052.1 response regulator [Histidinibacterium lentulum]